MDYGMIDIGPVQSSTRQLYEEQLKKRLKCKHKKTLLHSSCKPHPSNASIGNHSNTTKCYFGLQSTQLFDSHSDEDINLSLEPLVLDPPPVPPPRPAQDPQLPHDPPPLSTHYDWELNPDDIQFCVRPNGSKWCLGCGGFGEVFKGLKDGVDEVAVKVTKLNGPNQQSAMDAFKQEIDLISKLRHRNIVQFYGACITPQSICMVTELMQSDLFTALKTKSQYKWAGEYGKQVCIGIATGIHYLHSRRPPIVHRDIKSPNILLMDGLAKVADVGMAKAMISSDMTAQSGLTKAWAAPEVIYRKRATEKIDIWSYGVILWEVVTGRPPLRGQLSMPSTAPAQLRSTYERCLDEAPQQRPATYEILVALKSIT